MANTFKSSLSSSVSNTALATIYSAPTTANSIATLIGVAIANKVNSPVTVDVVLTRSTVNYYLIKSGVVPVGGTLTIAGADQKIVMQQNDTLQALASTASALDTVVSVLEIT